MKKNDIQYTVQDIEDTVLELFELYRGYNNVHISIGTEGKILSQFWGTKKFHAVHGMVDIVELNDCTIYYLHNGKILSVPLTDEVLNFDTDSMFNLYLLLDIKLFRTLVFCILEIKFFNSYQNRIYSPEHINEFIESGINV